MTTQVLAVYDTEREAVAMKQHFAELVVSWELTRRYGVKHEYAFGAWRVVLVDRESRRRVR